MLRRIGGALKEFIQVVFLALLISFVLRTYVVEAREIPSGSMLPTLQIGDRVLVDKIAFKATNLHREDIVVFAPPPEAVAQLDTQHKNDDLIKRIVGLPGDKVHIADGQVYVNGAPLSEPYLEDRPDYVFGPVTVPEDSVFVLGDNRNNSLDSHYWGFLPIKNIKGRAFLKYWPLKSIEIFQEG